MRCGVAESYDLWLSALHTCIPWHESKSPVHVASPFNGIRRTIILSSVPSRSPTTDWLPFLFVTLNISAFETHSASRNPKHRLGIPLGLCTTRKSEYWQTRKRYDRRTYSIPTLQLSLSSVLTCRFEFLHHRKQLHRVLQSSESTKPLNKVKRCMAWPWQGDRHITKQ